MPDIRSGYLGIRNYPELPNTYGRPDPDPDIKIFLYSPRERFIKVPRPYLNINDLCIYAGCHNFPPPILSLMIPTVLKTGRQTEAEVHSDVNRRS